MKKIYLALLVAAFAVTGVMAEPATTPMRFQDAVFSEKTYTPTAEQISKELKGDKQIVLAQATTTAPAGSVVVPPSNGKTTVTVDGGDLAAKFINWLWLAFGGILTAAAAGAMIKAMSFFGIQVSNDQRAQLQAVVVNGLNSAAAKAQDSLRTNDKLSIEVKNQVVQEAIAYTQAHAAETIKALGLDPESGDAVEAIRARIETAINDPATPTAPSITPDSVIKNAQPLAPNA